MAIWIELPCLPELKCDISDVFSGIHPLSCQNVRYVAFYFVYLIKIHVFLVKNHVLDNIPGRFLPKDSIDTILVSTILINIYLLLDYRTVSEFPGSRSTDFEVHRNWLAITHSLPVQKWYQDETSEWTLDYPPFFAYFEYLLSQFASFFDPEMVKVSNLYYSSVETIVFQRLSVIVTDIVYAFGVKSCIPSNSNQQHSTIVAFLLLTNIGLIFVDHIHFQYNGILFGLLLLSIGKMFREQYLQSAVLFAILLNSKHIFIYIAPVYVAYMLKFYVLMPDKPSDKFRNLMKLGGIVVGITIVSFGPFYNQIPQVLSRLFPFKRGLCHAYWAPNFWALYNIIDKLAGIILKVTSDQGKNTGGLVQEFNHQILPNILPIYTFALTLFAIIPCLIKIFLIKKYNRHLARKQFVRSIIICGCTSFLFGWHVHEKAILMVMIPLCIISTEDTFEASQTIFLSVVSHYSLFPLLFKPELTLIKTSLLLVYTIIAYTIIKSQYPSLYFPIYERCYLFGFIPLYLYENILQYLFHLHIRLPFLPLLLTSVYCSIGITYFWLKYYGNFLLSTNGKDNKKIKRK